MSRYLLILLSLSLFGCSLFNKPATINAIYDPEITVARSWMVQAGDGERSYYQRLKPVIYSNKISEKLLKLAFSISSTTY